MPFELHQQLGPLMKTLCGGFPWRVSEKLGAARSNLEDWSIMEHRREYGDLVYDLYYGGQSAPMCNTDEERHSALVTARGIVERGYNDCKPRRELMAAFDAAISVVRTGR